MTIVITYSQQPSLLCHNSMYHNCLFYMLLKLLYSDISVLYLIVWTPLIPMGVPYLVAQVTLRPMFVVVDQVDLVDLVPYIVVDQVALVG